MIEKDPHENAKANPAPASSLEASIAKFLSGHKEDLAGFYEVLAAVEVEASARNHLGAIVDSAEDAIISKNLDGIVQSWNPSAERIFGYTAAEMIGQSIVKLLPPGREEEEVTILARIRAGEHIRHFQTVRQRKDGTLVPISLTVSPVRDIAGNIIGASKIARDITAELAAQAEQEKLIARLQLALNEIGVLRDLIAICMHCKRIRNDTGYWQQLEKYFQEHADIKFTHGICPDCAQMHYGQLLSDDAGA